MLTTTDAIKQQTQHLAKLERQLARLKTKRRNEDTRQKILWGGLVVKAKLEAMPLAIFYEKLLDIKNQLVNEPDLVQLFHYKGEHCFMGYPASQSVASKENKSSFTPELIQLNDLRHHTYKKIQFGALIMKAKLPLTTKAQVLGALVSLKEEMKSLFNHNHE